MNIHNNAFQTACHDVKAICDATLTMNSIHYFSYARMYDDGSCYLLSNNEKVINYLFENEAPVFAPIPANLIRDRFLYFIPDDGPYQKVMHDVKCDFNIAHCFDMFEIHPGYVDVSCFGASADNNDMINYYFNNIDILNNYSRRFKEQASGLISTLNQNRILLSKQMQLNFKSDVTSSLVKTSVLSKRQKECLYYLLQGMTLKEIANNLNLSHRTVEHYLEAIKLKLNCNSRSELFMQARWLIPDTIDSIYK